MAREDVYQVLAYARRYATESAVLIYPHHAAVGRPGLQRDFVIQGGAAPSVVVRVVTLDLARLERVPGQVGEAVSAGKAAAIRGWLLGKLGKNPLTGESPAIESGSS